MRTRRACGIGVGVIVMLSGPPHASAQTSAEPPTATGRVFVEAAAIADYDQTDFESPGPALARGAAVGARLWRRYSVRFEFDVPGDHVDLFQAPGLEHRFTSKTTAFAFLFGRHFRIEKRVPIGVLAGVSALTHTTQFTGFIDFAPPDANGSRHATFDDQDVEQWIALTLGIETPIAITRHLHVVPQVRVHQVANEELGGLFPAGKSTLRPRLSVRWQF
jgi:hypothetical protein